MTAGIRMRIPELLPGFAEAAVNDDFDRDLLVGRVPWPAPNEPARLRARELLRRLDDHVSNLCWHAGLLPGEPPARSRVVLFPMHLPSGVPPGRTVLLSWGEAPRLSEPGAVWSIRREAFAEDLRDACPSDACDRARLLACLATAHTGTPSAALLDEIGNRHLLTWSSPFSTGARPRIVRVAEAARQAGAVSGQTLLPTDLTEAFVEAMTDQRFRTHRTRDDLHACVAALEAFAAAGPDDGAARTARTLEAPFALHLLGV